MAKDGDAQEIIASQGEGWRVEAKDGEMQRRMGCTLRFETLPAISMHHIDALRDAISHFALCTCVRQALIHAVRLALSHA